MLKNSNNEYQQNGVMVQPATPKASGNAKIVYSGLLAKGGAHGLYAHVGFDRNWEHTHDYKMTKGSNTFEADIPMHDADTLNIAFKDCADNWDNNSGKNYSFDIAH
ncbi:MAG: hypothetical protein H6Q67_1965 [Firmicutes bacterium]|nr:hypothetical protein [Bacillota bacterium]